jgi:diguanylate cyclase (GGDEF)-like protein/PAS domain S-box-containing protein
MNRTHDEATLRGQTQQAALFELLKSGTATAGTAIAFRKLTETAARTLGVRRVSIWLFDASRTVLEAADLFDLGAERHTSGTRLEAARYPSYFQALNWSRAIVAPDAATDPRTREFAAGYLDVLGIVSMMDAAIWHEGRALGVVCLEAVGERREWTPDEQHFAGSIADIASAAMSHDLLRGARARAQEAQELMTRVFNAIPDLVAVMRLSDKALVYVNESFERYSGLRSADVVGRSSEAIGLWDDLERRREWIERLSSQGLVRDFEAGFRTATGEVRTFQLSGDRVDIAGEPCMVTVARDTSHRVRSDRLLFEAAQGVSAETGETFFRSLVAHLARALEADIAFVGEVDAKRAGVVRTVAAQRDGKPAANYEYVLEGTPCATVLESRSLCAYTREVGARFPRDKGIESYVGAPLVDSLGTAMGLLAVLFRRPLDDPGPAENLLQIFAARAAAELERRNQLITLAHLALHDSLTQLPNRTHLRSSIEATLSAGQPAALVLVDLDHFKEINDTLGHAVGDVLLQRLAERLEVEIREAGWGEVARLGGDEFAVWREGVRDEAQARELATRVLGLLTKRFEVEGYRLEIGASVGIALAPRDATTADGLLRCADVAMYSAKRGRAGYAMYSSSQDPYTAERLTLLSELSGAFRRGEMVLHYQPRVSLAQRRLRGFEALVRWNHPRLGRLPPSQFIPLAELSDVIRPLTLWILEEGLRQQHDWAERGHPTRLAINFSARHLLDDGCPEQIAALLARQGTAAESLELEITESALIADPEHATATLERIRGLGRADRRGRLRHRLLVAVAPAAPAAARVEDRRLVRAQHAEERPGPRDRRVHRGPRPQPGAERRRRGHRGRGHAGGATRHGLRRGPGVFHRPADGRGRGGALDARQPAGAALGPWASSHPPEGSRSSFRRTTCAPASSSTPLSSRRSWACTAAASPSTSHSRHSAAFPPSSASGTRAPSPSNPSRARSRR